MTVLALTLDTNLLHEYWKQREKVKIVERLLNLAKEGGVDLAVTARVREDIPRRPLADRINELPNLGIKETGSVTRLGYAVLGRDMLGDEPFGKYYPTACALAKQRGKKPPDWRDWDHLHAHYLLRRDIFFTWDQGISCLSSELKAQFGIVVMIPEEFLQRSKPEAIFWWVFNLSGKVVGWAFLIGGFIVGSYYLLSLLSFNNPINVNGVPSTDLGNKLIAILLPYLVAAIGWLIVRAKPYYPRK